MLQHCPYTMSNFPKPLVALSIDRPLQTTHHHELVRSSDAMQVISTSNGDRKRKLNTIAKQKSRQNRNEQQIIAEREKNKQRERKNRAKKAAETRLKLSKMKPPKDKYLGMKPLQLSVVKAIVNEKPVEIKQPTRHQPSRETKKVSIDRNKCC